MKEIALVVYGLNYGGVERVCLDYLNLLKANGHKVDLFVLNPEEMDMAKEIPKGVSVKTISLPPFLCPESYWRIAIKFSWGKFAFPFLYSVVYFALQIYKIFIRSRKTYDVAIAIGGHINDLTFVAKNFVKAEKKMCWLHGGLYSYMVIGPSFQMLYQKIKNLVVLTDLAQNECLFFNRQLDLNIRKIYNPSFIASRRTDEKEISSIKEKYGDFIVMVARVDMPKNHKGLINAMEYLYEQYGFVYNIVFVGDGVLRKQLEEYASTTKIREHIFFVGNQPNPQNYYAAAKLFVLSTISEGLPTVLIEAAYFGLPLISSDASVREILGNNEFGLIAPVYDDKKLAQNIYTVLSNPDIYSKYSDLSKERYREFAPSRISEQIEDYINNLK